MLKVGAVLTVVEGLFILLLAPLYWPLIGLPWRPQAPPPAAAPLASGVYVPGAANLRAAWVSGAYLPVTWAQLEVQPGQFDWRSLDQHPTFVDAVRAGKPVGLQVQLQSTPGKPAVPAWGQVPQIEVAAEPGKPRTWPAVWSPEFQTAFPRFVAALAQRYDGDSRLAYVVMTEGTAIPYTANPKRWDAAGYSAAAYSQAYQQIYQAYLEVFHHTPLVAAVSHFGQESKQALHGGSEGHALRALLNFAGRRGLHFLVPEVYTRQPTKSIYVRDEMLWPALRQYAGRSYLLVKLDPGEPRGRPLGDQTLQGVQALWPEVPVRAVLLTR